MSKPYSYALGHPLDVSEKAATLAREGRVQCDRFVAPDAAQALYENLRSRADWVQVLNAGENVVELPRPLRAELPAEKLKDLDTAVYAGGRYGFQYRYESIRVPDDLSARAARAEDPVVAFAQWMNAPDQIAMWRTMLDVDTINFVDAQATAFSPGDFLTGHDDAVDGKGRHAAYVFSLNPTWRVEWGGLLLFHERASEGAPETVSGLVPSFNCLNIFRVPAMHSVSLVSQSSGFRRYGITGWIRTL